MSADPKVIEAITQEPIIHSLISSSLQLHGYAIFLNIKIILFISLAKLTIQMKFPGMLKNYD